LQFGVAVAVPCGAGVWVRHDGLDVESVDRLSRPDCLDVGLSRSRGADLSCCAIPVLFSGNHVYPLRCFKPALTRSTDGDVLD
jgi:hypothetical protein